MPHRSYWSIAALTSVVALHAPVSSPARAQGVVPPKPDAAPVVITEIMYDAAGRDEFEYVELYNGGDVDLDLAGYQLTDDRTATSTLTAGRIPAGGTAVLIRVDSKRSLADYRRAWGEGVNLVETPADTWPMLNNGPSGDTIVLKEPGGTAVAKLSYRNGSEGWPVGADGASIYLKDPATPDPAAADNWALSTDGVAGGRKAAAPREGDVGSPGTVTTDAASPEPGPGVAK